MKVAILGPICKDYIRIDDQEKSQIGSIVYYTGVALKKLGVNVKAFATFNEKDKKWIENNFKGIPIKNIKDEVTLEVRSVFSSDNPDFRVSNVTVPAQGIILPNDSLIRELDDFDWIILGPLSYTNISLELVEKIKNKNLIYGNFGIFSAIEDGKWVMKFPERLIEILPYLNYVFLDVNEAAFISCKKEPTEIADFFLMHGLKNLILTEGSKGSYVFSDGRHYRIPAFPPKQLVDPTGAGDSYVAGFTKALELYDDPEARGRFAAMVATISLEKRGAFDAELEEVIERFEKQHL